MKKFIMLLSLIALFIVPIFAMAEGDFTLDENAVLGGMDRSWAQGYEPVISGNIMTLHAPLVAPHAVGRVSIALRIADEAVSPFKGATNGQYQITDGSCRASLRLELRADRMNGDYSAELVVTGQDADDRPLKAVIPLVIRIRDGRAPAESAHPLLEDVSASLMVGEDGTLTARLTNSSRYAGMTGVTLTVTDQTGDVLPASTDKVALPDLLPGETAEIAVPLKVTPSAAVSLHRLQITLTWTALGQPGTWTETFTLPVGQTMRMAHGNLSIPASILQGNVTTLTLPLMNMGRAELRNVLATLVLPGVSEGQSVLVGTILAGESKEAKITFNAGKNVLGEVSGEVCVTYEDPWGNADSFVLPVSMTVEEPAEAPVAALTETGEDDARGWLVPALGGGCGVLLLALILQGVLLGRKIRRMEEDRL